MVQEDLDGDGSLDRATLVCSFATDDDRVQVYDGAGDMVASSEWQGATDFDNDTWIFDAGTDSRANLIVVFAVEGDRHIAYLYDDQNDNGRVDYTIHRDGSVTIEESRFWTARVIAEGDWWDAEGNVNLNTLVSVDGPIGTSGLDLDWALDVQFHDGKVDLEMETHTDVSPEMPAYSLIRSFSSQAFGKTVMAVDVPGSVTPAITAYAFWPYLGPGRHTVQDSGSGTVGPALRVDWADSRFDRYKGVNIILQKRPPELGWGLFSHDRALKDQDNTLSFENPFAYYDLAGDGDGWPELIVRHVYYPPGTIWYLDGDYYLQWRDSRDALQAVRYTWDQDNDGFWDYKLGLIGKNHVDTLVKFPDFGLVSIPYARLPYTLTENMQWEAITFVQVDVKQEHSPEGVYDWDDNLSFSRQYVLGTRDDFEPWSDIRPGFRGEYRLGPFQVPRLYFSSVDRKLHLLGAVAGVAGLSSSPVTRRLRCKDLDGDGYLDEWTFTTQYDFYEGASFEGWVKSLRVLKEVLVYSDAERVRLLRGQVPPSVFETLPPRNHEEWLVLGNLLDRYRADLAPDDFLGMMKQFPGPETEIEGASVEDFRVTEAGFRFVLDLQPGFQVPTDILGLDVAGLSPGAYLVTYGSDWQIRPLTPPHITLPPGAISLDPPAPREMAWAALKATLYNDGLQDVQSVVVRMYVARAGDRRLLLDKRQVSILGEGKQEAVYKWFPNEPGKWTVWLEVDAENTVPAIEGEGAVARLDVEIQSAELPDMLRPAAPYDGVRLTWPVLVWLGAVSLAALCVLGLVLRQSKVTCGQSPLSEGLPSILEETVRRDG
ncbi:MAG: hypothetical protein JW850_02225 [Thermoflexales bacterium]|nr:hypothetical protein [Thermoflexales bacterium]